MVVVTVEPKTVELSDAKPIEIITISVDGRQGDVVSIYVYFFREHWGYGWEEVFRLTNQCCIPLTVTLSTYVCNMSYRGRYKVRVVDVNTGEVAEEEVVVISPWEEPRERYAREQAEKAQQVVQIIAQQIAQIIQPRPPPVAPVPVPAPEERLPEEEEKEKPEEEKPPEEAPPEEKPEERPTAPTPTPTPAPKPSPLGLLALLALLLSESK